MKNSFGSASLQLFILFCRSTRISRINWILIDCCLLHFFWKFGIIQFHYKTYFWFKIKLNNFVTEIFRRQMTISRRCDHFCLSKYFGGFKKISIWWKLKFWKFYNKQCCLWDIGNRNTDPYWKIPEPKSPMLYLSRENWIFLRLNFITISIDHLQLFSNQQKNNKNIC